MRGLKSISNHRMYCNKKKKTVLKVIKNAKANVFVHWITDICAMYSELKKCVHFVACNYTLQSAFVNPWYIVNTFIGKIKLTVVFSSSLHCTAFHIYFFNISNQSWGLICAEIKSAMKPYEENIFWMIVFICNNKVIHNNGTYFSSMYFQYWPLWKWLCCYGYLLRGEFDFSLRASIVCHYNTCNPTFVVWKRCWNCR